MIINWYGEGCFKIQTGGTTVLVDPFSAEGGDSSIGAGLTPPRFKADLVIKTQIALPVKSVLKNEELFISNPGEYDFKGIDISGWQLIKESSKDFLKTIYLIEVEDLSLCFLGHITESLEPAVLEKLSQVDLLFIPAGGKPYIDSGAAAKLIKQIEPKLVVTSFFKIPGLKRKCDDVKEFLKELEIKSEPQEKLTIKKKELPTRMEVVVLKRE